MTRERAVVVVDGANVAYEEKSAGGKPRVANLTRVRRELEEKGFDPIIIIDASLKYEIDDQQQLETLIESQAVRQVPAGTDADYFILQVADQHDARIVTNDQYKDYRDQYPWIPERRLPYMIIKGDLHLYEEES
jgi:predicted nucleic acid-binding protein